ncbi:MAG: sigma-70 family RNA polymerase sigma factor [Isosphaeraceae bacterium]|nr:sigma-70 family RNA polymerase sigma factor [Isosphaeraceae bacterium]
MNDVARLLSSIERGDPSAAEQLLPLVYQDLRKLAAARLSRENPGQTLDSTALVHEAYLRLVGSGAEPNWESRGHFFAAAAEAMRRILVERARRKKRLKHGGDFERLDLDMADATARGPSVDLLALNEALDRFALEDPLKAELVKLRYFGGLTMPEIARLLNLSLATAERHWTYAKSWLCAELSEDRHDLDSPKK